MNTQEIKIKVPEGKRAVYDEATQTIKFVDVAVPKSKNFLEFCQNNPDTLGEYYFDSLGHVRKDNVGYERNYCITYLKTEEDAKGILALIQLKRLHDEWVGDWKPIYSAKTYYNEHQTWVTPEKYVIYYHREELIVDVCYHNQRFLTFPTKEMATEFFSCFKDLIETAKMFI